MSDPTAPNQAPDHFRTPEEFRDALDRLRLAAARLNVLQRFADFLEAERDLAERVKARAGKASEQDAEEDRALVLALQIQLHRAEAFAPSIREAFAPVPAHVLEERPPAGEAEPS